MATLGSRSVFCSTSYELICQFTCCGNWALRTSFPTLVHGRLGKKWPYNPASSQCVSRLASQLDHFSSIPHWCCIFYLKVDAIRRTKTSSYRTMASQAVSTHELSTFTNAPAGWQDDNEVQTTQDSHSLPSADFGKDAYLFLAACVGLEALVWGFPFAVSISKDAY